MSKINTKQIKKMLFSDIELLLTNLNIDYEIMGDNIYSTCPVHEDSDNSRAFSLSTEKQLWRCWTRDCQDTYGTDIFGLIQGVLSQKRGQDVGFKKALDFACAILNIDRKNITIDKEQEPDSFVKLVTMFSPSKKFVPTSTRNRYNLTHPSEYFLSRGFSEETMLHFEIGDCYDKSSSMYHRAVIPIHNDDGAIVVAHIGRSTKEYRTPKFLFTKGFDKRHFLYNYHRAIGQAAETSLLFVTEGQGDVWKLYESGIVNAVSIFGKALSEQQQRKIQQSGVTRLVILTDNDQAGRESKTQLYRQLSRMFKLEFPRLLRKDIGDMSIDQIKDTVLTQVRGAF